MAGVYLRARARTYNSGRGANYTSDRGPVRLMYEEAIRSVGKALAREHVLKQLRALMRRMRWWSARDDATTESAYQEP
jgi:predicted GIY-YIG superfamily endonuclease